MFDVLHSHLVRTASIDMQVWRHCIGSTAEQDALVFHEEDEQFYTNLGKSKDEKILIIHVGKFCHLSYSGK